MHLQLQVVFSDNPESSSVPTLIKTHNLYQRLSRHTIYTNAYQVIFRGKFKNLAFVFIMNEHHFMWKIVHHKTLSNFTH